MLLASSVALATGTVLAELPKFDPGTETVWPAEMLSGEIAGMVGPLANVVGKLRCEANPSRSVWEVLVDSSQLVSLLDSSGKRPGKSASTIAQTNVSERICRSSGII